MQKQIQLLKESRGEFLHKGTILILCENGQEARALSDVIRRLEPDATVKLNQRFYATHKCKYHIVTYDNGYYLEKVRGLRVNGIILYHIRVRLRDIQELLTRLHADKQYNIIELGWDD